MASKSYYNIIQQKFSENYMEVNKYSLSAYISTLKHARAINKFYVKQIPSKFFTGN